MQKRYFENCKTVESAKAEYKRLLMENHPDKGGSDEVTREIVDQFQHFLKFSAFQNVKSNDAGSGAYGGGPFSDPFWTRSTSSSSGAGGQTQQQGSGHKSYSQYQPFEFTDKFFAVLAEVLQLNVNVEVIGNWIYVYDAPPMSLIKLAALDFNWSKKHNAHYWADWDEYKRRGGGLHSRGDYSTDDLRAMWGSDVKKRKQYLE